MRNSGHILVLMLLALLADNSQLCTLRAQGTAFTYQGVLYAGTARANGSYDLRFIAYDNSVGGGQQGPILTNSAVGVSNGLFTVTLDFGNVFSGENRFLEIAVRTNSVGSFVTLSPRQPLTATPYAITAGSVTSGGIPAGTYGSAVTFNNSANNFSGRFTGDGSGLTNLNLIRGPTANLLGISAASPGFFEVTNTASFAGQVYMSALVVTNGFTDAALTASTLLEADANQKLTSLANGSGFLTNDGSGGYGFFPYSSLPSQTPLAQDVDAAQFAGTNYSALDAANFNSSITNLPAERWQLTGRVGIEMPVPFFTALPDDSVIALDVIPHGSPSESPGNGFAWLDVVDSDTRITNNFAFARMGARSDAIVFGSKVIGSASYKPIIFNVGGSDRDTIDTVGKVGVGNLLPQAMLHVTGVNGNGTVYAQATVDSTADVGQLVIDDGVDGHPQLLLQVDTSKGLVAIQTATKSTSFTAQALTLQPNGGITLAPHGLGQPTNAAPTGVTVGITAPDYWQKAYDARGVAIGFVPVWRNH